MRNERIKLEMTIVQIVTVMSEGNPGAVNVCMRLLKEGAAIDPDDFMEGMGSIIKLDSMNIYGGQIWSLYKDVCGEDIAKVIALLRANQLGQLAGVDDKAIKQAIQTRGTFNFDKVMAAVREILPNFNQSAMLAASRN